MSDRMCMEQGPEFPPAGFRPLCSLHEGHDGPHEFAKQLAQRNRARAQVSEVCPDTGKCHHGCAEHYGGACWRVFNAGPLSGVFEGDVWPDLVVQAEHINVAQAPDTLCRCWNEGEWGRVHREDCPVHGPDRDQQDYTPRGPNWPASNYDGSYGEPPSKEELLEGARREFDKTGRNLKDFQRGPIACRVHAMWEPDHHAGQAKPIRGTTFVSAIFYFTHLPARGDSIETSKDQSVTIEDREFKLDGSVHLYVGVLGGWDREDVIREFESHDGYVITTHN